MRAQQGIEFVTMLSITVLFITAMVLAISVRTQNYQQESSSDVMEVVASNIDGQIRDAILTPTDIIRRVVVDDFEGDVSIDDGTALILNDSKSDHVLFLDYYLHGRITSGKHVITKFPNFVSIFPEDEVIKVDMPETLMCLDDPYLWKPCHQLDATDTLQAIMGYCNESTLTAVYEIANSSGIVDVFSSSTNITTWFYAETSFDVPDGIWEITLKCYNETDLLRLERFNSESVLISQCTEITVPGFYIQRNDIAANGTCIEIRSNNVHFDGNEYSITGPGSGSGIYASGYNNTFIKNVDIYDFFYGIHLDDIRNGRIDQAMIRTSSHWIGSGTLQDPYQIDSCFKLQKISDKLDAHFALTRDIDCSGASSWKGGRGFEPIGDCSQGCAPGSTVGLFSGSLDGRGYTIRNLTITGSQEKGMGIFGAISSAAIGNLSLENLQVQGIAQYTGGIVGYVSKKVILENVNVSGIVISDDAFTGGLVGSADEVSASGISFLGTVNGTDRTGGLVGDGKGDLNGLTMEIAVSGDQYVGGVLGVGTEILLENLSLDAEKISGMSYVGGVIGSASSSSFTDMEIDAVVEGGHFIGGVAGYGTGTGVQDVRLDIVVDGMGSGSGGLFGVAHDPAVHSVNVSGVIDGSHIIGGIVGRSEGVANISMVIVHGDLFGHDHCGGIMGESLENAGVINGAVFSGSILCSEQAGGIVGWSPDVIITNVSVAANISAGRLVGGIIAEGGSLVSHARSQGNARALWGQVGGISGSMTLGIENSYSTMTIEAPNGNYVGGIMGEAAPLNMMLPPTVLHSYYHGSITAREYVGGIVGSMKGGVIDGSFVAANISGMSNVGAVAGYVEGVSLPEVYYNVSGLGCYGSGTTSLDDCWQVGASDFLDSANRPLEFWDFTDTWTMKHYPALKKMDGAGTAEDPYRIRSCQDLSDIRFALDAHYEIVQDIDCSDSFTWPGMFQPIGNCGSGDCSDGDELFFTGELQGNGHMIHGAAISVSHDWFGLFGAARDAVIEGLHLNYTALDSSGVFGAPLLGYAYNVTLSSIKVDATIITQGREMGGVVADGKNVRAQDIYVNSMGGRGNVGGFAARIASSHLHNITFSGGLASGPSPGICGGIAAEAFDVDLNNSQVTAWFDCNNTTGGLFGKAVQTSIEKSDMTGFLVEYDGWTPQDYVSGGLVGEADEVTFNGVRWYNASDAAGTCIGNGDSCGERLVQNQFWGNRTIPRLPGSGTVNDPYLISTCEELQVMEFDLSADYALDNDINCTMTTGWNDGQGFIPVGYLEYESINPYDWRYLVGKLEGNPNFQDADFGFKGSFDGRDHTIFDLHINHPDRTRLPGSHMGLFARLAYTPEVVQIKDLTLSSVNISGQRYVAGVAGSAANATLSNVHVSGFINSTEGYAAGLIGLLLNGNVSDCSADVTLISASVAGGLISSAQKAQITDSTAIVNISAHAFLDGTCKGGIMGAGRHIHIERCSVSGSIMGDDYLGGIFGGPCSPLDGGSPVIIDSYADVHIVGDAHLGGIGGEFSSLRRVYATGRIDYYTEEETAGGIGGGQLSLVEDSFAVMEIAGSGDYAYGISPAASSILNTYWYDFPDDEAVECVHEGSPECVRVVDLEYFMSDVYPHREPFAQWDFPDVWKERANSHPVHEVEAQYSQVSSAGILLSDVQNISVEETVVEDASYGVIAYTSTGNAFSDNSFCNNGLDFACVSSSENTDLGNVFGSSGCGWTGVSAGVCPEGSIISSQGCTSHDDCDAGMVCNASACVTLTAGPQKINGVWVFHAPDGHMWTPTLGNESGVIAPNVGVQQDILWSTGPRVVESGDDVNPLQPDPYYPAAHYCHTLQYAGYDDWYLPPIDDANCQWNSGSYEGICDPWFVSFGEAAFEYVGETVLRSSDPVWDLHHQSDGFYASSIAGADVTYARMRSAKVEPWGGVTYAFDVRCMR
ncbi:MAG: NosD domain-containing protein [Nanoarchaeota archaeon]